MAILITLLALATAVVIAVAMISRRPVFTVAAAILGIATMVAGYLAVKDYVPIILAVLLGVVVLGGGIAAIEHFRRRL